MKMKKGDKKDRRKKKEETRRKQWKNRTREGNGKNGIEGNEERRKKIKR